MLVLDEPTQGVDVGAKADIHDSSTAAAAWHGAVICSSDNAELERLCTRVIVLQRGAVIAELRGDEITSERIEETQLVPLGAAATVDAADPPPADRARSTVVTTTVTSAAPAPGRAARCSPGSARRACSTCWP